MVFFALLWKMVPRYVLTTQFAFMELFACCLAGIALGLRKEYSELINFSFVWYSLCVLRVAPFRYLVSCARSVLRQ